MDTASRKANESLSFVDSGKVGFWPFGPKYEVGLEVGTAGFSLLWDTGKRVDPRVEEPIRRAERNVTPA